MAFCTEVSGQHQRDWILLDSGSVYEKLCAEMLETARVKGECIATYCGDENKRLPDSQVTKEFLYLRYRKPDGSIVLLPQSRTHFFAKVPVTNDSTWILCLGNRILYVHGDSGTIAIQKVDPRNQNFDVTIQDDILKLHADVENGKITRMWRESGKRKDTSDPDTPVHQE
ncbi:MAG: hypothetical protein JNL57_01155 [Bacteroidetes bacterium]|nr:hypothetical protein [Bacteroidota bacterium]